MYKILYPKEPRLPKSFNKDLDSLFKEIQTADDWRSNSKSTSSYKTIAETHNFILEKQFECLKRKQIDLFKLYPNPEIEYGVAIEIETSTIENGYNDLLKIMQLLKSNAVDYGVIIFIQNNRSKRPKLTKKSIESSLIDSLDKVLDDFRGKLFILHINLE